VAGGADGSSDVFAWDEFEWDDLDLEAAESWSKWGLSRGQLVMAAAVTGAAAGGAVDAATAFLSHGAGALIGGVGGGVVAFFKGEDLPDLKVDMHRGVKFQGGEGRKLELGPPKNENFQWILLDQLLLAYVQIQQCVHGRRDEILVAAPVHADGFVRHFGNEQRKVLGKWLTSCARGRPDRGLEPEVFRLLVEILEGVDQS